jgi:hypothetical protein
VSTLHRSSAKQESRAALASSRDTSWPSSDPGTIVNCLITIIKQVLGVRVIDIILAVLMKAPVVVAEEVLELIGMILTLTNLPCLIIIRI